ncbi:hypothetical protein BX600DRAFT_418752 [Xylariales sp. PMI_506]|nr:hypothetical protein BX600DRAFT_418752 [Xylariales sp. PMI_506]
MEPATDQVDEYEKSQEAHQKYPANLVRKQLFLHNLERYQKRLQDGALFHSTDRSLYLWDLVSDREKPEDCKFQANKLDTAEALQSYIREALNPRWRFIFLHSRSSRSALGCTKDQFTSILTHHQVMSSFLDLALAFKGRTRPVTHAMFRHENYLQRDSPKFSPSQLGRSGIQLQHAYNLLSVERTDIPNESNQWPLRQTAIYHSFDMVTGQTLFIVLKANTHMLNRITKEVRNNQYTQPRSLLDVEGSFLATLLIQLIVLEWCTENWSDYIDYFEQQVREESTKVKMAPISAATSPVAIEMSISRRSTMSPTVSRMNTFVRQGSRAGRDLGILVAQPTQLGTAIPETPDIEQESQPTSPTTPKPPIRRRTSSLRQSVAELFARKSGSRGSTHEDDVEMGQRRSHESIHAQFNLDDNLSFEEFQRINRWSEELDRSLMVIEQNQGVLRELRNHYTEVAQTHGYTANIKNELVSGGLGDFFRRIDGIVRDLSIHHDRLRAVARILDNDKALYGAALQYQSGKVSQYFAEAAKESSNRMEDWTKQMHSIAIKTEHETVSMHVITIFTLIFLPGTFVATFFSSGAIQWNDDGTLGADYIANPGGLRLFFAIIIPLTVVVMIVWALVYYIARRKRKAEADMVLPQNEKRQDSGLGIDRDIAKETMSEDTNPQPANDFYHWVEQTRTQYAGDDLRENQPSYIPYSELDRFWSLAKISAVFRAYDKPLPYDAHSIRRYFLRIFSTLVLTGTTRRFLGLVLVDDLDDERWPLDDYPRSWPKHDYENLKHFKSVLEQQWTFFPYYFRPGRLNNPKLKSDHILPIMVLDTIRQQGGSAILKIGIEQQYNNLKEDGNLDANSNYNHFVLKQYGDTIFDARYQTEVEALTLLRMDPSENLVRFYGSFRKDNQGYLLLEYADGGSLQDLFRKAELIPKTATEVKLFWTSLLKSLRGLDRIHQWMSVNDYKHFLQGIHQDIKPDNILLFHGLSSSIFEFTPKIADFGLFSHARKTHSNSGEARGLNKQGVSTNYRFQIKGGSLITPLADIFSMGAVLSAAAAWVVGGSKAHQEYFQERQRAHSKMKKFNGSGYEGCFHDGAKVLEAISQRHSLIREHCNSCGWDDLTPRILDIVERYMLLPKSSDREQASRLLELFGQIIEPEPLSPVLSQADQRQPAAVVSIVESDGGEYDSNKPTPVNSIHQINNSLDGKSKVLDSTVKNLVDQIVRNLGGRDQLFFIDDSTSMLAHKNTVLEGFQALSSIAKRLDPDRVELAFASNPNRIYRARKMKVLVQRLKEHQYRQEPAMMEKSLSQLVHNDIIRKLPIIKKGFNLNIISRKPVSVYIFTDGNWGEDPERACRVERPVQDLMQEVKRRNLNRNQVTLHFVRFGDNEHGVKHLEYLDRFGEEYDCDIVDVKHISSDVVSVFYGPLSYQSDKRDEVVTVKPR